MLIASSGHSASLDSSCGSTRMLCPTSILPARRSALLRRRKSAAADRRSRPRRWRREGRASISISSPSCRTRSLAKYVCSFSSLITTSWNSPPSCSIALTSRSCVSGRGDWILLHAAVDARRLEDADQDRERAVPLDLLQVDHLLVVDLADDDPRQLHLDGHMFTRLQRASQQWQAQRRMAAANNHHVYEVDYRCAAATETRGSQN